MPFLNHNGLICSDKEVLFTSDNRAFRFGEGLVETMLWKTDDIRCFDLHILRLQNSLKVLNLPFFHAAKLNEEIYKTIMANQEPETGMIRAQFFTSTGKKDLQFIIEYVPLDKPTDKNRGLRIGISRTVVKSPDSISHLKTTSRMHYSMAKKEAEEHGWDDALLLNPQENIAESTICNVFIIKGDTIFSPPLNEGCVDGVMRKYILKFLRMGPITFLEKPVGIEVLKQADEIFLTNAIRGVQPVHFFEGRKYDDTITRKIIDKINAI